MIERRLKLLIVTYLWVALVEVTILFVMAWIVSALPHSAPAGLEVALLLRSAAQSHSRTPSRFGAGEPPVSLDVSAGGRFFDLFTDVSHVVAVPC